MLTRKSVVLAKPETNYGVDSIPTVAANAIFVSDLNIKPTGETLQRNYMQSSLSQLQFDRGSKTVDVTFKTEFKGTGTRGALPAWGWEGVLLRACGLSESITAGTSIVYAPVSDSFESCTLYGYRHGIFHKITGCRGSVQIVFEVGKHPYLQFTFKGLYVAPADSTPGAQTFSSVSPAKVVNTGFTIGGYAGIINKLEIDLGNTLAVRKSMNAADGVLGIEITGRAPKGSIDPEAVVEATFPFWNKWETAAALALAISIGSTAGNTIAIAAPKVQFGDIGYADRDGQLCYQIPLQFAMNAGDDELSISIT